MFAGVCHVLHFVQLNLPMDVEHPNKPFFDNFIIVVTKFHNNFIFIKNNHSTFTWYNLRQG